MNSAVTPSKKSSAIERVAFDSENQKLLLNFVSNLDRTYIYNIKENMYEFVVQSFNDTNSYGSTYHDLLNLNIISPE